MAFSIFGAADEGISFEEEAMAGWAVLTSEPILMARIKFIICIFFSSPKMHQWLRMFCRATDNHEQRETLYLFLNGRADQ
jgi:hypothetical protein